MRPLNRATFSLLGKQPRFFQKLGATIWLLSLISSPLYAADHSSVPHSVQNPRVQNANVGEASQRLMGTALSDLDSAIRNHEAEVESGAFNMRETKSSSIADSRESNPFDLAGASPGQEDNKILSYPAVKRWQDYFLGKGSRRVNAAADRLGPFRERAEDIFAQEGLPADLIAVGFVESGFVSTAVSPKGATGPWQFMPATASRYGLELKPFHDDRKDFEKSTSAASRYLADLHDRFGDWLLALAAYNTGEDRVEAAIARGKTRDFWTLRRMGLLPEETQEYVPKVLGALQAWKLIAHANGEADGRKIASTDSSQRRAWVYATASGN